MTGAEPGGTDDDDRRHLQRAVDLSRGYLEDDRKWPFGAVLVVGGAVVAEGVNRARLPRVMFGATSQDVARCGVRDLEIYQELAKPAGQRSLREDNADDELRRRATAVLSDWAGRLGWAGS